MEMIVEKLKAAIGRGLPGTDIQWEMASSDRMINGFPRKGKEDSRLGAVLILIYPLQGSYHTVFIQRPDYNGVHSGQIGFPGGKMEKHDSNLVETAIREAYEETGVRGEDITIAGTLTPLFIPVSNIVVTPVVAFTPARPDFNPSKDEVVFLIESEIPKFTDPSVTREKEMEVRGELLNIRYYDYEGHVIWGATAMILHELLVLAARENISFRV